MTEEEFIKILNMNNLGNQDLFKNAPTYCFTDHFCNKLYYRSISNDKSNVLCKRRSTSFDMIKSVLGTASEHELDYLTLSDRIQPYTWKILLEIKQNFLKDCKRDFRDYFKNVKRTDNLHVESSCIISNVIRILESIVPSQVYGCRKNQKEFYNTVRFVLSGMSGQHVTVEQILNKWTITSIAWLNVIPNLTVGYKVLVLLKFIVFLIKYIVCSVIAVTFYVTTSQASHETRKLYYYFRSDWQKLSDTFIKELAAKCDIVKSDGYSVGSKSKRRVPLSERSTIKSHMKTLPIMRLMLKSNNSIRVIIRYKKKTALEKKNEKIRRYFFKAVNPRDRSFNLMDKYFSLFTKWTNLGKPKLYFVKADLFDAFGSVDINALLGILSNLHTKFQNTEKNSTRKKMIAREYERLLDELNRPVLVRQGSCVYEWKRGLVQGMKYSPILCEIFYKEMDRRHLLDFFTESEREIKLLVRLVDDYLLITDSIDTAREFIRHMSERINPKKTITNFKHDTGGVCNDRITFFGYVIDTHNLEVSRDEAVYAGQLKYRITFNKAISEPFLFLEKRITQTTVPLSKLFLSLRINSNETVWKNVFVSLCISANKFCSIIPLICCDNENLDSEAIFNVYKRKVAVRMCDFVVRVITESLPHGDFHYCINHFRYVAYKALSLFATKSNVCMKLLPLIKKSLKKSNCMEGTWKPHYGSVDREGVPNRMAIKEVCHKYDIKKNILQFNSVPDGFEPYIR